MSKNSQKLKTAKSGSAQRTPTPARLSMKQEAVSEKMRQLGPEQDVVIRFKRDCVADLNYLVGMHNNGIVAIDTRDLLVVLAVNQSRSWELDGNRTVRLKTTPQFDLDWFFGRLERRVEYIGD